MVTTPACLPTDRQAQVGDAPTLQTPAQPTLHDAGKSYTMTGSGEHPGLIPRLCSALFERISKQLDATVTVEVSYMEIYNEKVFDLLDLAGDHKTGLKVG